MRYLALAALAATTAFAVTIPRPAGDVVIQMPGKPPLKLSQYRGKVVILAFIDTGCSHCQHATEVLDGIQREYFTRGVQVLEGAFNPTAKSELASFQQRFHTNFPVGVVDPNFMIGYAQITPQMRPMAPVILFIDRKGVIRAQWFGNSPEMEPAEKEPQSFRAEVDNLLQGDEPPHSRARRR
jgi:thiol-disulfide isomerase/thioredoxin